MKRFPAAKKLLLRYPDLIHIRLNVGSSPLQLVLSKYGENTDQKIQEFIDFLRNLETNTPRLSHGWVIREER